MSTTVAIGKRTKELLDLIRGDQSYNSVIQELASERIHRLSQPPLPTESLKAL